MSYRELQVALKKLRDAGKIPGSTKLNQKKEVLQAIFYQYCNDNKQSDIRLIDIRNNQIHGLKWVGECTLAISGDGLDFETQFQKEDARAKHEYGTKMTVPVSHIDPFGDGRNYTCNWSYA